MELHEWSENVVNVLFWRYLNSVMASFLAEILLPFPNLNYLNSCGWAEGMKNFDFNNPKSLEKALSGKELHPKLLVFTKKY